MFAGSDCGHDRRIAQVIISMLGRMQARQCIIVAFRKWFAYDEFCGETFHDLQLDVFHP